MKWQNYIFLFAAFLGLCKGQVDGCAQENIRTTTVAALNSATPWLYLDSGVDTIPANWFDPLLADGTWHVGNAPFGATTGPFCSSPPAITPAFPLNTNLYLRKHFSIPGVVLGSTFSIIADNDIIAVYLNGVAQIGSPFSRDNCGTAPGNVEYEQAITLTGPFLANNVIAIQIRDRGVLSYFDAKLIVRFCATAADPCLAQAKACNFYFSGNNPRITNTVPAFAINGPDNVGFTPRILAQSGELIGVMNSNREDTIINPDASEVPISSIGLPQRLSRSQFKPFTTYVANIPIPQIGHETFQGNIQCAQNRCVKVFFDNWQVMSMLNPQNVDHNINNGGTLDCVVFRTLPTGGPPAAC